MEYNTGKRKFIDSWGELGINWGVNKTMGHIHALLLISNKARCCESIMKELDISRGSANMNLRALIKWGLVHKKCEDGCRKEFFTAEKDIWTAFKMIIKKRKEKELEPLLQLMSELSNIQGEEEAEIKEFNKVIHDIEMFSGKANNALEHVIQSKSNFLVNSLSKMLG